MPEKIIVATSGKVARISLNNPDKLNCMGFEMLHELDSAIERVSNEDTLKAVLITGEGERAFSTGADLKEFSQLNREQADEWIIFGNKVFNRIEELPKPTVAMINGYAIGGGLELALACDFRMGTRNTVVCSPELQHGWLPGWGGMTRLRRLIGEANAKEMVMLNEKIPAVRAMEIGILNRILGDDYEKELNEILNHLTSLNPKAFSLAKAALMDAERTTRGVDMQFDVLALQMSDQKGP